MSLSRTWDEGTPTKGLPRKHGATQMTEAWYDIWDRMSTLIAPGSLDDWQNEGYNVATAYWSSSAASVPADSSAYTTVQSCGWWNPRFTCDLNIQYTAVASAADSTANRFALRYVLDGASPSLAWQFVDQPSISGYVTRGPISFQMIASNVLAGIHTVQLQLRSHYQDVSFLQNAITISPILLDT